MKVFLIVLVAFITANVYGQKLNVVYNSILPKEITKNESLLEDAIDVIERDAKINPELIYYRVKYYNEIYKYKNTDKKTNGYDELNSAKIKYTLENNALLDKEINALNNDFLEERHSGSVESFWTNHKEIPTKEKFKLSNKVDKNLMNFYVVFYYSKGETNKYEANRNYLELRKKYEAEIRDKVKNISVLLKNKDNIDNYGVSEIIENNFGVLLQDDDINYSEILLLKEKADYSIQHLNKFSVGLGMRFPALNKTTPIIYTSDKYEADVEIGNREDVLNIQLELGYKVYLKEEIDLFSYLNISAFYINSNANINLDADGEYIRKTIVDTKTEKIYEFYTFSELISTNGSSHNEYGLNISTPIWVFNPQLVFEFGLQFYYKNNYSIDMTYNYKKVKAHYNSNGYIYKSEVLEEQNDIYELYEDVGFCVAPSLSFQYLNVLNHFDLKISYVYNSMLYDQITAGISYSF